MSLPIYTNNDRRFQNLDGIVREALNEHAGAINQSTEKTSIVIFKTIQDVINATTDEGDSGFARGLSTGAYIFDGDFDMGLYHLVLLDDATYTLLTVNLNTISYSGTLPFITNAASAPLLTLLLVDLRFSTPNATAISLFEVSSLIMKLTIFVACKKAATYTDSAFMTLRGVAMVLCDDGITCDAVTTMQIDTLQWSDGPDVAGIGFRALGACERLIISGTDARPTASEFFFDIDATYTGSVSITGGTFSDVGTFFKGARDQSDPNIRVNNVINVKNSVADAFGHVSGNSTETVISTINTPVILNAVWTDVDESRFTFLSSGRWTYTGLEDICVAVSFTSTIDPVGGGSRDVSTYLAINGTVDANTQGSATLSAGGQITSIGIIDLTTGDFIEAFVENNSGTQNIIGIVCSMVIG